ncbi:MAG TPA: BamA/TamA family outer membrane protein [Longimicrobiales bacterium]
MRSERLWCALVWLAAGLAAAAPASAQEPRLPPERVAELFEFFNRPGTIRMTGPSRIARGAEIVGDLAVLGGPLHLAGRVRGRVVVLNGGIDFEPGAEVLGDVVIVGGTVAGLDSATVTGTVEVHREALRYRLEDGRLVAPPPPEPEHGILAGVDFGFGRTDLTLAAHRGYNRVEGLPVVVGPTFETRSANPTRIEAFLIYRTESGVEVATDDVGYLLRLEQFLGGAHTLRVGATLHSEIVPIEAWGLRDRENSLSTFLLRRDYRDHYERVGWSAYLRVAPPGRRHDFLLGFRDERHTSVRTAEPWTLFGDSPWRPQPRIAEGRLRSLVVRVGYDTRNEAVDPAAGWWIRAEIERGLGGSLAAPAATGPCDVVACLPVTTVPVESEFAAGFLDLRRYARISPSSRLALRVVAATSLNDRPLPPQRQHVLGGEGSLPAYGRMVFDCGARAAGPAEDGLLRYYGCDRLALVQIEYRTDFPFGRGWGRKLGWDIDLGETPGWVVFFDAGRAWTERAARHGRTEGQDDFAVDVGAGLRLGRLGVYWAAPLSGGEDRINFFVRIGSRI